MAELSKSYLRGFLVPHGFTSNDIDTTSHFSIASNFTEEEIIADTPVPYVASRMYVGATGNAVSTSDYDVVTSKAGVPTTAEYLVTDNENSTAIDYGINHYTSISDYEILSVETVSNDIYEKDALSFDDGSLLIVAENDIGTAHIKRWIRDKNGNVTSLIIHTFDSTIFGNRGNPAVCKLSDGSVLLFISDEYEDKVNAMIYRSTDKGTSWTKISSQILSDEIDTSSGKFTLQKARMRELNGQILLLIQVYSDDTGHTNRNQVLQYVSIDGGGSFQLVTNISSIDTQAFFEIDLFINRNKLCLAYIAETDTIRYMELPHAFYTVQDMQASGKYVKANSGGSANDFASGTDQTMSEGSLTAFSGYDDSIRIIVLDRSDTALVSMYSNDGINWNSLLTNASPTTQPNIAYLDSTNYLNAFKAVIYEGGAALIHGWQTPSNGNSLAITFLGGYSNVTFPFRSAYYPSKVPIFRMQQVFTYLPIMTAASTSIFTSSGTGTEVLNAASGYTELSVSMVQSDYLLEYTNTYIPSKGIAAKAAFKVVSTKSGATATPAYTYLSIQNDSTSGLHKSYRLILKFSETEIFAYNNTTLIQSFTWNNDEGVEILATVIDDKASFFYRKDQNKNLRQWTTGFTNQTLTSPVVTTTDKNIIKWGIEGSPSNGIAVSQWNLLNVYFGSGMGNLTNFQSSDLIGNTFPTISQKAYLDKGISIYANNGPTYVGDSWQIKSFSFNGIDNIFPSYSPSPRVQWKSDPVTSGNVPEQRITLNVSTNATSFGNDLIGIHLSNINFASFKLQYLSSGSWVDLDTIPTYKGMRMGYLKEGKAIKQDTTSVVDQNYFFLDELKDCIAYLVGSGFDEHIRITGNTEGGFGNVSGKQCKIFLESEPTGDGQLFVIPKSLTAVYSLNGIKSDKWAILITAQTTIDNQFRIGSFMLGPVIVAGTQYSKGRKITIESGTINQVTQDRTMYTRVTAPVQRTVQISWSDGVDISSFYDSNPDPDYYKSSSSVGSEPISAYEDVPYLMEGILRRLEGNQSPLVYLPSLTTSQDDRILNRSSEQILCKLNSEVSITSVTGEELVGDGTGEVMRVGTVDLLEIV